MLYTNANARYSESVKILYSCTSFVFESPYDIHAFRLIASSEGLAIVNDLVLAFGRVDWAVSGPLCESRPPDTSENVKGWVDALSNIHTALTSLQRLQIWMYHHNEEKPEVERRPWVHGAEDKEREERHQKLFDVLGTIKAQDFILSLSWNLQDIMERGKWPFKIDLRNWHDISGAIDRLPSKTVEDLYD
jgi:hypothetical protein